MDRHVPNHNNEKKLKVLVCTTIFPNQEEKTKGIYIFHQINALSARCIVKVIAPIPYFPKWISIPSYKHYNKIPKKEKIGRLEVSHPRYIVTPKIGRIFYGVFYFFSLYNHFLKIKKELSPDLLLCYWAYPDGFACVLLSKITGIPVVLGCRGCDVNDADSSFIRKKLVKWTLHATDGIMAVSQAMKEKIISFGVSEKKVVVIPNGVNESFKVVDSQKAHAKLNLMRNNEKVILFCGRLSHEKGLEYLVEAASLLNEEGRSFKLIILGDGVLKEKIKKRTKDKNIEEKILFFSEVPHDEVVYFMNSSYLLCLPSLREGWPNVVMEAIACGLPVVATDVGGVPEIIVNDELGFLVPPGDSTQLANALSRAMDKRWDKEKMREYVKGRTWEGVAEKIEETVISILR